MNLSMKQKQTPRYREQTKGCQEGFGGGKDWECGINRCTLLCVREINNKILLYSTGNYIQYAGIKHIGKEHGTEYKCKEIALQYTGNEHNTVNQLHFN